MSKKTVLVAIIGVANMSGEDQDASQQGTNDVVRNYHDSQYQEVWLQDTRMFCREAHLGISQPWKQFSKHGCRARMPIFSSK